MRLSKTFSKTQKNVPTDVEAANARLLTQAGFVDPLAAGIFSFLPLGWRVLQRIQHIIRQEMIAIGAEEIFLPALHPDEPWKQTGRWTDPGPEVMFQFQGREKKWFGLGWTHEEIVTPIAKKFIRSYQDLPAAVFQIQTKFRNEPRAKSGLLRGREFSMKDLYSFHATEKDLAAYYETVKAAYGKIFSRCGLDAIVTEASGGAFSAFSHEFQILTPSGEDEILFCRTCRCAQNREISALKTGDPCFNSSCAGTVTEEKAIEVGNIFQLQTRFSNAFDWTFTDEQGTSRPVFMGCYGLGPSRVMGAIVEAHHDERGIVWPKSVAPFPVHLISLGTKDAAVRDRVEETAASLDESCKQNDVEILWDDREGASAGEKMADADLIGIPLRLVVSERSLSQDGLEWKERRENAPTIVPLKDIHERLAAFVESGDHPPPLLE